jgi:hypothetical protein
MVSTQCVPVSLHLSEQGYLSRGPCLANRISLWNEGTPELPEEWDSAPPLYNRPVS